MTRKFELAPTNRVDRLRPEIDRLLEALGHPEALVTDQSSLWDFDLEPLECALVEQDLGITFLSDRELLVDVAARMRDILDA